MRPEVSEEGRNSCKMQKVSFQIQAKIELTNNTNKTLQQNIPKRPQVLEEGRKSWKM